MLKILFSFLGTTGSMFPQTLDKRIESTLIFAEQQILETVNEVDTSSDNLFPRYFEITHSGKWISNPNYKQTSGFFTGCLLYLYPNNDNTLMRQYAVTGTNWLENAIDSNPSDRWPDSGQYNAKWYGKNESGQKINASIYNFKMRTDKFTTLNKIILLK